MNAMIIDFFKSIQGTHQRTKIIKGMEAYGNLLSLQVDPKGMVDISNGAYLTKLKVSPVGRNYDNSFDESKKVSSELLSMLKANPGRRVEISTEGDKVVMNFEPTHIVVRKPMRSIGVNQKTIAFFSGE